MDQHEARLRLERTTAFRFREGGVVLRDVRLLSVVTALRHQPVERVHAERVPAPVEAG